jgi:pyridoxine 5-phosphate synthase
LWLNLAFFSVFPNMIRLLVNIDHVATLRNARGEGFPDPVEAAILCEKHGAEGIVFHLREDRRHIKDMDVTRLKAVVKGTLDFEMAASEEMVRICGEIQPHLATLVPEKRQELTTEGGLDVLKMYDWLHDYVYPRLKARHIEISLFVDPDLEQIDTSARLQSEAIELHTGTFAHAFTRGNFQQELDDLAHAAERAHQLGMKVNAGHGLNHQNLAVLLQHVPHVADVSIGHALISDAIFRGLPASIEEMLSIIKPFNTKLS